MKKIKNKSTEVENQQPTETIAEILEAVKPLVEIISPLINKNLEVRSPIIRRSQWMNYSIMIVLTVGIIFLSSLEIIDGSAATGLLGAIIGYVFGHIYSKREK